MRCSIFQSDIVRSVIRKLIDDIEDWMRCDLCKRKDEYHRKLASIVNKIEFKQYNFIEVLSAIDLCNGGHQNPGSLKLTDIPLKNFVRIKVEALIIKHINDFRSDGRFDRFDFHSGHLMEIANI